jgi:class 3 adenylate cyclase
VRRPILVENMVTVPYAPEQLWRYVADTQRMDRAVGLPKASFTRSERTEGGEIVTGEYRLGRRLVYARWREHPFAWERPRHYSVLREYERGPIVRFHGGADLEPVVPENGEGERTRIRVFGEFTPRHPIFAPFIRHLVARRAMRRSQQQYETIAAYIAGQATRPFVNPPALGLPSGRVTSERIVERLTRESVPLDHARRLAGWLLEMDDTEVAGMRPIELAQRWETNERETIEAFLRATTAGILEMRWELICPSCRGVKAEASHLRNLPGEGYCPACHMPFSANVDEAIEARFYPAPSIRRTEIGSYCVGSPMDTPHRLAQATVQPGQQTNWRLRLAPGTYTIRSPQSRGVARIEIADEHDTQGAELTFEPVVILPEQVRLAAGDVTIQVMNQTPHILTAVLDDGRWARLALTPGTLMTLPAFRALFSVEALAAGVELSITRVGLLFTDLAGSTALYERAGEGRAFRLVGEHFEILRVAIEEAGGAVIKTIGDAVMGAFPDGESALQAAIAIQQAIHTLDTGDFADPASLLKIGLHAGPCYAVTLNDRLDYFGAAVNLAARAQHEARGGQIVATAAVYDSAPDLVTAAGLVAEPFEVLLRGISAPVQLYRIDCGPRMATIPADLTVSSVSPDVIQGIDHDHIAS